MCRVVFNRQTGLSELETPAQKVTFCPPVQVDVKMTPVTRLDIPWLAVEFKAEAQAGDCTTGGIIPIDMLIFNAAIYKVSFP